MSTTAGSTGEVYLLVLHEAYTSPEHPVPINGTIVHARTLLHPRVPQPGGGLLYRRLIDVCRQTGELVPLSTLAAEAGGHLADVTHDWEAATEAIARIAREGKCDAIPLGLPDVSAGLLAMGPQSRLVVHSPSSEEELGPEDRARVVRELQDRVHEFAAQAPFWPGDGLGGLPTARPLPPQTRRAPRR